MKSLQYSKIFNIFKAIKKGKIIEKEEDLKTDEPEKQPEVNKEPIEEFKPDDLRNEDMLGDHKFTPTKDLIKQIKENQQLQESNKAFKKATNYKSSIISN